MKLFITLFENVNKTQTSAANLSLNVGTLYQVAGFGQKLTKPLSAYFLINDFFLSVGLGEEGVKSLHAVCGGQLQQLPV
jgi:hypothetical protein